MYILGADSDEQRSLADVDLITMGQWRPVRCGASKFGTKFSEIAADKMTMEHSGIPMAAVGFAWRCSYLRDRDRGMAWEPGERGPPQIRTWECKCNILY